jgi:hypothetical protein
MNKPITATISAKIVAIAARDCKVDLLSIEETPRSILYVMAASYNAKSLDYSHFTGRKAPRQLHTPKLT